MIVFRKIGVGRSAGICGFQDHKTPRQARVAGRTAELSVIHDRGKGRPMPRHRIPRGLKLSYEADLNYARHAPVIKQFSEGRGATY
jgi:hypothetical protein